MCMQLMQANPKTEVHKPSVKIYYNIAVACNRNYFDCIFTLIYFLKLKRLVVSLEY